MFRLHCCPWLVMLQGLTRWQQDVIMHSAQTISETMNCEFFCKNRMIVTETMALQASHDSFNPSQYHCQLSFGKADVQEEYFYVHDVKRHLISINSHCAATAMYLGCVESESESGTKLQHFGYLCPPLSSSVTFPSLLLCSAQGTEQDFENVFEQCSSCCRSLLDKWQSWRGTCSWFELLPAPASFSALMLLVELYCARNGSWCIKISL